MNTFKICTCFFAAASSLGLLCSCSQTDDIEAEEDSSLPQLVLNLTSGEESTRASFQEKKNDNTVWKARWYDGDITWAYSPSKGFYNKLVPQPDGSSDEEGDSEMPFVSDGKVDYTVGERLVIIYCGDKTGNGTASGTGSNIQPFSRTNINDINLAIIYGKAEHRNSDDGNPFFIRAASSAVNENGSFDDKTVNVRSYMPFIRLGLPAAESTESGNTAEQLSKLDYKITVTLKSTTDGFAGEGFPNKVNLQILEANELKDQEVFKYPDTDKIEWGNSLSFSLKASDTEAVNSSALWYHKVSRNIETKGYVLIPFPCIPYDELKVTVEVTNSTSDTSLNGICGTYTYTLNNATKLNLGTDLDKDKCDKIYSLGNIWTNGTATKGSKWSYTASTTE